VALRVSVLNRALHGQDFTRGSNLRSFWTQVAMLPPQSTTRPAHAFDSRNTALTRSITTNLVIGEPANLRLNTSNTWARRPSPFTV